MKNYIICLALITAMGGCQKKEIGIKMGNVFPTFNPNEEAYAASLPFADSISGSFEYKHTSHFFGSKEKNIAVIYAYIDPNKNPDKRELAAIKEQFKAAEPNISNLKLFTDVHYRLMRNGEQLHAFEYEITH